MTATWNRKNHKEKYFSLLFLYVSSQKPPFVWSDFRPSKKPHKWRWTVMQNAIFGTVTFIVWLKIFFRIHPDLFSDIYSHHFIWIKWKFIIIINISGVLNILFNNRVIFLWSKAAWKIEMIFIHQSLYLLMFKLNLTLIQLNNFAPCFEHPLRSFVAHRQKYSPIISSWVSSR